MAIETSAILEPVMSLLIRDVVNPSEDCLQVSHILVQLFSDPDLFYIMSEDRVLPSLGCADSCAACLHDLKDFCTACPDGYALHRGTCVQNCPIGTLHQD